MEQIPRHEYVNELQRTAEFIASSPEANIDPHRPVSEATVGQTALESLPGPDRVIDSGKLAYIEQVGRLMGSYRQFALEHGLRTAEPVTAEPSVDDFMRAA